MAHGDGLSDLEVFNTIDDCWTSLSKLPEHCGLDGVAIIGFRSKVRIKPSLNKTSGKSFLPMASFGSKIHILVQEVKVLYSALDIFLNRYSSRLEN